MAFAGTVARWLGHGCGRRHFHMTAEFSRIRAAGKRALPSIRIARPGEDNFAHPDRIEWILGHIPAGGRVVEVGCGTGWGVTIPTLLSGASIVGVDLDESSIAYGRQLLLREGADERSLIACDLRDLPEQFDVAIASELLEHLHDHELREMLRTIRSKLKPCGTLLVTVPNGYGWYELEALVWRRTGIGRVIDLLRIKSLLRRLKLLLVSGAPFTVVPTTLSACPHVRRFTLRGLMRHLQREGFEVVETRGSVMFCGPFSDMLFGGARGVQRANVRLGRRYPHSSAGFYVAARARPAGNPERPSGQLVGAH